MFTNNLADTAQIKDRAVKLIDAIYFIVQSVKHTED